YGGALPADAELARAVHTTGFVAADEVGAWLAAADACVVSMRDTIANRGRWPGKVNEYMTAGRATVMPEVGDAARLVSEHGAGIVCAPEPHSFARAIACVVKDDVVRSDAERRAVELAVTTLAWNRIAAQLDAFYVTNGVRHVEPARASA
ncbi:MAG: glycosyltransferase, partial [Longimicrobiales bacterium]